jgi:hypothetical protein
MHLLFLLVVQQIFQGIGIVNEQELELVPDDA